MSVRADSVAPEFRSFSDQNQGTFAPGGTRGHVSADTHPLGRSPHGFRANRSHFGTFQILPGPRGPCPVPRPFRRCVRSQGRRSSARHVTGGICRLEVSFRAKDPGVRADAPERRRLLPRRRVTL